MKKPYFCAVAVFLSFLCGCGFGQFRAGDSPSGASTAAPTSVQLEPSAETAQTQTSATADNSVPDGLEALQEALQAQLSGFSGQWSVYVKRLDTGQSLCLSDSPMVAASLIKLFVAGAAFQAIADGTLPAGVYDAPIRAMISASDNASCNALIDALGGGDAAAGMEAVNGFAEELGCRNTRLNRKMLASRQVENYTSAADCGQLLEAVYSGRFVSPQASEAMLEYLREQTVRCKIPALLPEDAVTGSKAGDLDDVDSDVAIVCTPACDYVLCILSNGVSYGQTTHTQIAELSRMVYDFFNAPSETPE